ncbi:hypothetical protein LTR81_025505 [Elasticomyces elasticus]
MHPTNNHAGIRVTQLGLLANLILAIARCIASYFFHSQALPIDGFHSLGDLLADFVTLTTGVLVLFYYDTDKCAKSLVWQDQHQVLWDTLSALYNSTPYSKPLEAQAGDAEVPDPIAAWVAAASILVKEWFYQATIKVARHRKSAVLASNAMHHRIDSLRSIISLLTIGCTRVFVAGAWCDPVGCLVIGSMVVRAGWENTM